MPRCLWRALLPLLFLTGCESFIDLDEVTDGPPLAVSATFSPDSAWTVRLSRTRALGDTSAVVALSDATVRIERVGTGGVVVLSHIGEGRYTAPGAPGPLAGEAYRLAVEQEGEEAASALAGAAPEAPVFTVGTPTFVREETYGSGEVFAFYRFRLSLRGVAGGARYAVSLTQVRVEPDAIDRTPRPRGVAFSSDDPELRASYADLGPLRNNTEFFGDAVLRLPLAVGEPREIEIVAAVARGASAEPEIRVRVVALSGELEQHLQTRALQDRYEDDPFAEPVRVYSNVEGGVGIFAGYRVRETQVPLAPEAP